MNNDKAIKCWIIDRSARALRFETSPGRSLLLPYEHFGHAEFEVGQEDDTLKLVFAGHEVVIRGHNLRILEAAIQKRELASIRSVPPGRSHAEEESQPLVTELTVMARKRSSDEEAG